MTYYVYINKVKELFDQYAGYYNWVHWRREYSVPDFNNQVPIVDTFLNYLKQVSGNETLWTDVEAHIREQQKG